MKKLEVLIVSRAHDVASLLQAKKIDLVIEEHLFRDLHTSNPETYVFEVYSGHSGPIKYLWRTPVCFKQSSGIKRLYGIVPVFWARTYAGFSTEDILLLLEKKYKLVVNRHCPPRIEGIPLGYFKS